MAPIAAHSSARSNSLSVAPVSRSRRRTALAYTLIVLTIALVVLAAATLLAG